MCLLLILLVAGAGVFIGFQLAKKRNKSEEKVPVYICPECGEHDCNCYLEQKVDER